VSSSGERVRTSFDVDEAKLTPPPFRDGIFDRRALLDRLVASPQPAVLAVVAPAGYGKTTLLAQWAARHGPRLAWLSADDRDNDPSVLLTHLAVAVDRVEPIDPTVFRSVATPGGAMVGVGLLIAAIAAMRLPVAIVLDDVEALTTRAGRDVVGELAIRLPAGSRLAIGSRREVPVPVSLLRARGGIREIGIDELAMTEPEARTLLEGAGLALADERVDELVSSSEGWPAGLYLAALAIKAGSRVETGVRFTGDDRFVGDYIRSEFLHRVSRADVTFLTRTSILERMSGPLGDAVTGRTGSGRVLDRLERRNLLVIPLDHRREWYRYHHLFRDLLHAELLRREPAIVPELHTRAAAWFEDRDMLEAAIDHARLAGDVDRVARLVLKVANPTWASGRLDTVLRWMEWFSERELIERQPAIAVHGALIYALSGKAGDAERWARAAERTSSTGTQGDGNTMAGSLAYLRALLCRDGPGEMRRDARLALEGLGPLSPYRAAMLHAAGAADLLEGQLDQADVNFARALDEATSAGLLPFIPLVLASRGIVATVRGDWSEAEELSTQALAGMDDGRYDDYWTSALVYAFAARVQARQGDLDAVRQLAGRAARLRPLLTHALPIVSVQTLLELARTYITIGDRAGASAVLRQVRDISQHRPDLGDLSSQADELGSRLETLRGEMSGISSLTTAELRVLPLLPTHLSMTEISEHLFVSRNTIKSHTISIYRKFGVSSRGETITRMYELGLVPHPVVRNAR
jgi:LuxR family maltose regulon positive regulatory protein